MNTDDIVWIAQVRAGYGEGTVLWARAYRLPVVAGSEAGRQLEHFRNDPDGYRMLHVRILPWMVTSSDLGI